MPTFITRQLEKNDWDETAQLIYKSLNTWYRKNRGFDLVTGSWETMRIFPRVYEALDPGCCVLAVDTETQRIAGLCFYHIRNTHVALGIMNVHPDFFGQGVGSLLVRFVVKVAEREKKTLRLVSSSMNLESFSTYNKAGFEPTCFFQDMVVTVPQGGFAVNPPSGFTVRDATGADVPAMVALEKNVWGLDREKDYRFFLKNDDKIWHTAVLTAQDGAIHGFLASVRDPGSNMLGPGIAKTDAGAAALVRYELNRHIGFSPVWLVPSHRKELVAAMYELGAKNCELHISQVIGETPPCTGIIFPTFMPETA